MAFFGFYISGNIYLCDMSQIEGKRKKKENIHDHNFKHNFTKKEVIHDFLKYNLPKEVLEFVDLETVKVEPNEILPSRYRSKRRADILYSLKSKKGEKLYTLVHLEGQSSHDKNMAMRVWEYHVAIAKIHFQQGHKKIPLILTFVLYHGSDTWTSAKSVAELFSDFNLYASVSLKAPFLINLTKKEMKKLVSQEAAAAPQMIMKGQATGEHSKMLEVTYPLMQKYHLADDENIEYMATTDKHGEKEFLEKFRNFDPQTANNYKTMFEDAIKRETKKATRKVRMEALKEGKKEGLKEGMEKGREAINDLLKKGVISEEQAQKALDALKKA